MSAEILALTTALALAVSDTLMGEGIRTSTPYTGAVVLSFMVALSFGVSLPWVLGSVSVNGIGLLWFLLVGMAQIGLGMFFFYLSMRRVGVARAAVISASAPAFSVVLAVLFLGEQPSLFVYLGTAAIVLGVMATVGGERGEGENRRPLHPLDLVYPLLTAFFFAVSPLFRKVGLAHIPSVPLGVAVAGLGGLGTLLLLGPAFPPPERFRWGRRSIGLLLAGGVVMAGAQASYFASLRTGLVSVVVPLIYIKPIFVSVIVFFLGRRAERVGGGVFAGAVLMAAGAWMVLGLR